MSAVVPTRRGSDGIAGIGIDIEEPAMLNRLGEVAVRRVADRFLSPAEREWCDGQPSLRRALTIVLCCREAVFKACRGAPLVPELAVRMGGGPAAGRAAWTAPAGPAEARVAWRLMGRLVVAVALAGGEGCPSSG